MSAFTEDHPLVRAAYACPICKRQPKDKGLLACWDCFRGDMREFPNASEQSLDMAEERLAREAKLDRVAAVLQSILRTPQPPTVRSAVIEAADILDTLYQPEM